VLLGVGSFSPASDIWAFGMLMYEVCSGGAAPYGAARRQDVQKLLFEGYRLPCPVLEHRFGLDVELHQVMLRCWHDQPALRSSAEMLLGELGYLRSLSHA